MKQQLDTIIQKLKTDQYYAVTITNTETYKTVCRNKEGAQMVDESGSVEDFFNALVESGNIEIAIQPRRKNGSSFKDDGLPIKLSLRPKVAEQVHEATPMPSPTLANGHAHNPFMGLMAGLNAHEAIYRHQDYPKIEAENTRLRLENEGLKEKISELKEAALEQKFSETKASGNKELVTGLMSVLPELMTAFSSMKGGSPTGLASPAAHEQLSADKAHVIESIKIQPDTVAQYMSIIIQGINTNQAFGEELVKLMQTHKLIP